MKERGQIAHEVIVAVAEKLNEPPCISWPELPFRTKRYYTAIERAVRNAALEEAARLAEVYQKDAQDPWEWPGEIANTIRALIEKER